MNPVPVSFPESEFEMDDSQNPMPDQNLQIETNEPGEFESVDAEEAGETLSTKIARFLRTCWLRRKVILVLVAAGVLISILYAFSLPNIYTSTTTLMPPDNVSPYSAIMSALSPNSPAAELGSSALGLNTPGDLFISILESRDVEDGLISRFNLAQYYKTRLNEDTRRSLAGDTSIEEDRKSGIITISVKARNPVFAATLANGYVDELSRVVNDNTTFAARRERIFLEERVKEVKEKLDETAKDLSQFSTRSGAVDVPSQTKSMVDEGLKLQAELIDGRSQLAALRETYSEDSVRVRALEAHNAELQRELGKMSGVASGVSR
jgi:capsule polysaccharide export protein KpsE/RkpR